MAFAIHEMFLKNKKIHKGISYRSSKNIAHLQALGSLVVSKVSSGNPVKKLSTKYQKTRRSVF